jgi:hypothetical protein
MLVGFWVAGKITDANLLPDDTHAWQDVWVFPAIFAAAVFVLFGIFFKNERIKEKTDLI